MSTYKRAINPTHRATLESTQCVPFSHSIWSTDRAAVRATIEAANCPAVISTYDSTFFEAHWATNRSAINAAFQSP